LSLQQHCCVRNIIQDRQEKCKCLEKKNFQVEGRKRWIEMDEEKGLKKEREGFCVGTLEKAFPHKT